MCRFLFLCRFFCLFFALLHGMLALQFYQTSRQLGMTVLQVIYHLMSAFFLECKHTNLISRNQEIGLVPVVYCYLNIVLKEAKREFL